MNETLELHQIAGERGALQRVEIGLAVHGTNGDGRIAAPDKHEVHQQTRGAPVAVAKRMNGSEPEMRFECGLGR
jgi:hypothetical protein